MLVSPVFQEGEAIPQKYTGKDCFCSPPLLWTSPPEGTRSFALVCDDPDGARGTFTHWLIYNLPADCRALAEGVQESPPSGAKQLANDFGKIGYTGPPPPHGEPHHYYFRLYALDSQLNLPADANRLKLLEEVYRHFLAEWHLMGRSGGYFG